MVRYIWYYLHAAELHQLHLLAEGRTTAVLTFSKKGREIALRFTILIRIIGAKLRPVINEDLSGPQHIATDFQHLIYEAFVSCQLLPQILHLKEYIANYHRDGTDPLCH
jgi:hypothetical protein